jgi:hypothetical protein
MRIGLVSIYVDDQDKAERFYTPGRVRPGQSGRGVGRDTSGARHLRCDVAGSGG